MKVGVLGSGDVAKSLADGFAKHGHHVVIGDARPVQTKGLGWPAPHRPSRRLRRCREFRRAGGVGGQGYCGARRAAGGPANVAGQPVIDATNPIADSPPVNGVLKFFTSLDQSLMERLQREFADARLVKAFNSVGNSLMVNPQFAGGKPTMFICGNNEAAKKIVSDILDQFGWEIADMGKVEAARAIEPLCMLWCIPGFLRNDWTHAFKLLRQE